MTKRQLESLTSDELLDECYKQDRKIAEIRGYSSGLAKENIGLLSRDTLIRCYLENAKNFNL